MFDNYREIFQPSKTHPAYLSVNGTRHWSDFGQAKDIPVTGVACCFTRVSDSVECSASPALAGPSLADAKNRRWS